MKLFLRFILSTSGIALLLSCATVSVKPITGPDGTTNQLISCYSVDQCYNKATELCGGTYKIVNSTSDTSSFGGKSPTSTLIQLLVKCDSEKHSEKK